MLIIISECIVGSFYVITLFPIAVCFPPSGCLNGGFCGSPGICSCPYKWIGERCDEGIVLISAYESTEY